ncbi:MAG: flagellar hook protein [Desulfosporosinus sp. BRH_c37]|nr:MAG: flagellar hook protein [Desulfosporosinus sp. BRH_c37]
MSVSSVGGTYGLSGSGMDIDTIVKNLMAGQQAREDSLIQKKTVLQWQKTSYNKVYDDINSFRSSVFNYKLQGTLSPNKVSSSNTSVATATANAEAADVNHSLVVAQLADGVKLTSSASLSAAGTTVDKSTIASQFYSGTAVDDIPTMSITIANGSASATIKVSPTGSINDLVSQINNAGVNVTANYDSTLDRFFLTTNNSGATADISFAGSNVAGMSFLTDKLKLPVSVIATGSNVSSSGNIQSKHIDPTASLASQFTGLTNSTLKLSNSATGTTMTINIDTTKSLVDLMTAINTAINDGSGNATASFETTTGLFSITPLQSGTLSIDDSDQSAKDLFSQLHIPAAFNAGKVTTSTSSVNIPIDTNATLQSQFAEFSGFGATDTFTLQIDDGTGTNTFTPVVITPVSESLQGMLASIHSAVPNVNAAYDSTTGKVTLTSANGQSLNFSGSDAVGTSFLANTLKLHQAGKDAVFSLDGVPLAQASNSFSISGVTYNLTGVSTDAKISSSGVMDTTVGQATSVSVTNDVDKAVAGIQSLVDSYNKILADLNGMVTETRYKDYAPLTDAQKAEMKDSDITAWEAKAKSGMLHGDSTLNSLVNTMRNAFSSPISGVSGIYNSASAIGITSGNYTEGGKLYLDTDKLRKAMNANPNVLSQLFGSSGTTNSDGTVNFNTQGIAGRLYDGIKNTMDQLVQKAGTTINAQYDSSSDYAKRITSYTTQIDKEADRFDTMQAAYYKQYNAMEVALQQLNSQSSWLSSMLDSSSSS